MKTCPNCAARQPSEARFCMRCGTALPADGPRVPLTPRRAGPWTPFALTLGGSLLLSLVLIFVFHLPILFLAGALPLFWFGRDRR